MKIPSAAFEQPEEQNGEQKASSQMENEGCPNGRTASLSHASRFSRNGEGRRMEKLTTEQSSDGAVTMSPADVLDGDLKPLCSRDNHVMKYESASARSNVTNQASYHCGFEGCSVRYDATEGYYMLIGMPDHANPVDEPGVNTLKCPIHGHWLFRRKNIDREPSVDWCCGVEDCDYRYVQDTNSLRFAFS